MHEPVAEPAAQGAPIAMAAAVAEVSPPAFQEESSAPPVYREEPSAPPSYETEQVREFRPREPVIETPQPAPTPAADYAPPAPLRIEMPSDLQQVESDPEKVRAVLLEPSREPATPRPRRVRPAPAPVVEEPLVQIETDRADAQAGGGEKTPA
jgi:hypothetical protein